MTKQALRLLLYLESDPKETSKSLARQYEAYKKRRKAARENTRD